MRQALSLTSLLVIAAFVAGGCVDRASQQQAKRTEEIIADPTKRVLVQDAKSQTLVERVEITGEVTTASDVRVGPKSPGRLVSVSVSDGDTVQAGQVIAVQETTSQLIQLQQAQAQVTSARSALSQAISNARIAPSRTAAAVAGAEAQLRSARAQLEKAKNGARPEEKAQAESAVVSARSQMETAKKEAQRQRELYEAGAASRQRVEQAENALAAATAQFENATQQLKMIESWVRVEDIRAAEEAVKQAEAAVSSAKANRELDVLLNDQVSAAKAQLDSATAQLKLIQQAIDDATIRAPLSGRVSGVPAQPGQYVGPGEPVARIIGLSAPYFEGEVPETVLGQIKMGASVDVRLDALPDQKISGIIAAISPDASSVGRLFRVRVVLSNSSGGLRPGMFARGAVSVRVVEDAKVVPLDAVVRRAGEDVVFVIEGDTAKLRKVKLGIKEGGFVQVTNVTAGEKVVVSGQTELDEGSKVLIEDPKAAPASATARN